MSSVSISIKNSALSISGIPDGFLKSNSAAISSKTNIDTTDLGISIQNKINTMEEKIETLQTTIDTLLSNSGRSGITEEDAAKIATNISTKIATNIATTVSYITNFSIGWVQLTNSPNDNGVGIACSGNGQYILKLGWGAQSYLSNDFGITWNAVADLNYYQWAASMSFDGKYIVVTNITGGSMMSSNYGVSWSNIIISGIPQNSKVSFSGKNIVIATSNGLFSSTNDGSSFSSINSGSWKSVTLTSDGQTIFAIKDSSPVSIWKTSNDGTNWTNIYTNPDSVSFDCIYCSSNGRYLLLALGQGVSGFMYLSSDYGATFSKLDAANGLSQGNYFKAAISASGMYMTVVCNSGFMFYSTNFGKNWSKSILPSKNYYGVSMSDSGSNVYVYAPGEKINIYDSSLVYIPPSNGYPGRSGNGSIWFDETTNTLNIYNSTTQTNKSITLN